MDRSPVLTDRSRHKNNKRFPKRYDNREKLFKQGGSYYEYPTMSWPYEQQNVKGRLVQTVNGQRDERNALFTRTITDRKKNIKGVIYHPTGNKFGFERAKDVYPRRGPC